MIITLVLFFGAFTTLAYPAHQAKAAPVAGLIPAGITVGAGAYTLTALALAAGASAVGYDAYSEQINAHAKTTWGAATDLSKDSMNAMIEAARGAGNVLQPFSAGFDEYMSTTGLGFGKTVGMMDFTAKDGVEVNSQKNLWGLKQFTIDPTAESKAAGKNRVGYYNPTNGSALYSTSGLAITASSSGDIYFMSSKVSNPNPQGKAAVIALSNKSSATVAEVENAIKTLYPHLILTGAINADELEISQNATATKYKEAWEDMRDAGIVLPVDGITPYVGDKALKLNEAGDRYTDDAGTVYNPSEVDYAFPVPRIRTDDVPVPGVYVDTPALTGNPTIDEAITSNPAIPKTTTNVQTGETFANPDIPIESNPPITGNPSVPAVPTIPDFDAPGTTGFDFTPLMMTGTAMTNKFPFSIPFDFVRQIRVLDVEPVSPSFDIDIPEFIKLGSFVIPFKMKLSFEMFDPIAEIIRWGMIIIWDISLIFAIRKLLPE